MKTLFSKTAGKNLLLGFLSILFVSRAINIRAQSTDENKTLSPYFLVLSSNPETDQLPLKNTSANVNIVGVIADVTVHQVYKNEGKNALEAIYTFPASTNAAVYAMEMKIGTRIIKAKIEEKQKARNDYEQAKSEGKRTSLLEQERPNVFQMNVANIMPGDEIEVTMKYTEMLIPTDGTYQFVYPTVVGPRYSGESSGNTSSQFVNTPYQKEGSAPFYNFDIHISFSAGMPIQSITSASHKITTSYPQPGTALINLDPSKNKGGNRDFILNYQLSGEKLESGLMLYEHGDENFFLLSVQPPKRIIKEEIPPREYIFIMDVSGSMQGFPISVSKSLIRNLVVNLRPTDKFNLVVFAGGSAAMNNQSIPATPENVDKACRFLDNQNGSGGTNLLTALQNALSLPKTDPNLSRSFVIITDGYVDIEKEAFDLIKKSNDQANLFTFGIGSSVNRYLIEGMAHAGLGEPFIVTDESMANDQANKFRKYINNPVLTNIKKSFSNFDVYDVEPVSVPDVFAERPVLIYGKYKGQAKGSITIKGTAGNKSYTKTFNISEVKPSETNSAIRYLWARKRIQMLDDYNNAGSDDNITKEITDLGLKYNLLTAYTSFIAIEEEVVNKNGVTTVKQPLPLPEGVSNSAVGFEMEVDGEEASFSTYKEIAIETIASVTLKEKIQNEIETNFISRLNACLSTTNESIESIKIMVDASGKITGVTIEGSQLSDELKETISQCVRKWNFNSLKLAQAWSFEIKF